MEEVLSSIGIGWFQVPSIMAVILIQGSYPTQHIATIFTDMPRDFMCDPSSADRGNSTSFNNLCSINTTKISIMDRKENLCSEFVYDTTLFDSTFSSEFNLVCKNAWLSGIYKTSGFFGIIFGCFFTGMGDKFGRASMINVFSSIYLVSVLVVGLSPEINSVVIARFLLGFCYEILNSSSYILMMEILPVSYQSTVGAIVCELGFSVFSTFTGIVSYFIRSWRTLQLTLSFPIYLLFLCNLFIHKSPRWLIHMGKIDESMGVLEKGAKNNNVELPSELLDKARLSAVSSTKEVDPETQLGACQIYYSFISSLKMLLSTYKMRTISLTFPLFWFLTGFIFFFIPLNANNFTNNPFLYTVVMAIAEIPPAIFTPILVKYLGNIKTISMAFILAMLGLVSVVFVPDQFTWIKWLVTIISMMVIASCYIIGYILGSELFPTPVRSVGFGMGSIARYTGLLTVQYVIDTASSTQILWLPNAVAAGCCLVASIISIGLLPETHGQPLCDTVEQVENRNKESIKT